MGYAISWLANRGTAEATVLAALGLEKTGQAEDLPRADWSGTRLGDWTVIYSNSFEPRRFRKAASKMNGEVVIFDVEEHVMFAAATAFQNGALAWRIRHDAQQAGDHLHIEGKPPEILGRIQAEQFARVSEDREVDFIIDIPTRVAEELVGFRYDKEQEALFDILRPVPRSKSFWKFW